MGGRSTTFRPSEIIFAFLKFRSIVLASHTIDREKNTLLLKNYNELSN